MHADEGFQGPRASNVLMTSFIVSHEHHGRDSELKTEGADDEGADNKEARCAEYEGLESAVKFELVKMATSLSEVDKSGGGGHNQAIACK